MRRGATCQRDRRGNLSIRQVVSTLFLLPKLENYKLKNRLI